MARRKSDETWPSDVTALLSKVDKILLFEWDPIGIKEIPQCQDEYDGYAPKIAQMILREATVDEIARHLQHIVTVTMGMGNLNDKIGPQIEVAEKLISLRK